MMSCLMYNGMFPQVLFWAWLFPLDRTRGIFKIFVKEKIKVYMLCCKKSASFYWSGVVENDMFTISMFCLLYLLPNLTKILTRTNKRFSQISTLNTKSRNMAWNGLDPYKVMFYASALIIMMEILLLHRRSSPILCNMMCLFPLREVILRSETLLLQHICPTTTQADTQAKAKL